MSRLVFEVQAPVVAADPNRADIACFVGFVARRKNTLVPSAILRWLNEQGWIASDPTRPNQFGDKMRYSSNAVNDLLDVPVPIDSWEVFDHLFEWERRPLTSSSSGTTYLGAAVRSFFAQGGRKCYVVRVGDPWKYVSDLPGGMSLAEVALAGDEAAEQAAQQAAESDEHASPEERKRAKQEAADQARKLVIDGAIAQIGQYARCRRLSKIARLIPGFRLPFDCNVEDAPEALEDLARFESSPLDQSSWHGIGHLFGLPDVSFLSLPDLVEAVRAETDPLIAFTPATSEGEEFVECSSGAEPLQVDNSGRFVRAPRCDDEGYGVWANALRLAGNLIASRQREVQIVAAVPIPVDGSAAERDLNAFLTRKTAGPLSRGLQADLLLEERETHPELQANPPWFASAFVQLAYPWVRTPGSINLPEQLESPDAVLIGLLARNALMRGAFYSAANLDLADVYDVFPVLRRSLLESPERPFEDQPARTFLERVSLFGPTPRGLLLLSDVTTSLYESYRPAGINRLVSSIVRAARRLGEESTFEPSGEELWAAVRDRLRMMLAGLWADGGLSGKTETDAFDVRCDRSTMTQSDIDNGRVVSVIQFQPAAPIEQITIVLAMDEGGQVSLVSTRIRNEMKEAA